MTTPNPNPNQQAAKHREQQRLHHHDARANNANPDADAHIAHQARFASLLADDNNTMPSALFNTDNHTCPVPHFQARHDSAFQPPFSHFDQPQLPPRLSPHLSRHYSTANSPFTNRNLPTPTNRHTIPTPREPAPTTWPDDDVALPSLPSLDLPRPSPNTQSPTRLAGWPDDELSAFFTSDALSEFVAQDFSSPSTYPSFTGPQSAAPSAFHATPSPTSIVPRNSGSPPSGPSQNSRRLIFEERSNDTSANTSFAFDMPPTTRQRTASIISNDAIVHQNKRRRPNTSRSTPSRATVPKTIPASFLYNNPFAEAKALDMIDLTGPNELPEVLLPGESPKEDKRIKLAAFQCVICMDDVTNLTVTHCGKHRLHPSYSVWYVLTISPRSSILRIMPTSIPTRRDKQ